MEPLDFYAVCSLSGIHNALTLMRDGGVRPLTRQDPTRARLSLAHAASRSFSERGDPALAGLKTWECRVTNHWRKALLLMFVFGGGNSLGGIVVVRYKTMDSSPSDM
jgi:hypothetical protein